MTKTQALLAIGYLASVEADEVFYRYPPADADETAEANRLADLATEAHDKASAAGATDTDWHELMVWFGKR